MTTNAEQAQKGGTGKTMAAAGAALLLVVAGIFAGPALRDMLAGGEPEAEAAAATVPAGGPALYTSLHPPLVVNFSEGRGDSHFMQVTMEVMARDPQVIDAVKTHAAAIRNNLILLYGNAEYEAVVTREGKERMLADALEEIQGIVRERTGRDGVEAVYFTNLIIQ